MPARHRSHDAVPGIRIFHSFIGTDSFGAYPTIEKDSSKFDADRPSSDVVFTWPTPTNLGDDSGYSRRSGGIHYLRHSGQKRRPGFSNCHR